MANPEDTFAHGEETPVLSSGEELVEQFPRQLLFEFTDDHGTTGPPVAELYLREAVPNAFPSGRIAHHFRPQGFSVGQRLGWHQTDQSYENDGFRFHYAFSIASMTTTGWSAVMRNALSVRRRNQPEVGYAEDGSRAMHTEEYLFGRFGRMAVRNGDVSVTDAALVETAAETVRAEMAPFLPRDREITVEDWKKALISGYNLWSLLKESIGTTSADTGYGTLQSAFIYADLDSQEVRFSAEGGERAKSADPL